MNAQVPEQQTAQQRSTELDQALFQLECYGAAINHDTHIVSIPAKLYSNRQVIASLVRTIQKYNYQTQFGYL